MSMIRMRLLLRSLTLVLTGCCLSFSAKQIVSISPQALSSQGSKAQRTVTGTVVNSITGEPLRRALVRIDGAFQGFAFTGADGHFQIDHVPEGQVFLTAQKPGFSDFSQMGGNGVTLQQGVNEALLKLKPEAGIQGRITDSDGEPIEGVQVRLIAEQIANGRKEWQPGQIVQTRENGTYRMENLMPGVYLLYTVAHPVFGFRFVKQAGQTPQEAYPERFYPNSPDLASAQPIDLKPGEEAQADFTLSAAHAFSVSGSAGPARNGTFLSISDSDGQQAFLPATFDQRTGRFLIPTIPPGSWVLNFRSREPRGEDSYQGEQTIAVGSSDITGLQVLLQPLASIPITVAGDNQAGSAQAQVQLISREKFANNGRYAAFPQPGDSQQPLTIRGVAPGRYLVSAQPMGAGCIDSVSSGSTDLTREDLIVSAGSPPPPISVTLRNDCASVSGSVHAEGENEREFVIFVSESASMEPKIVFLQQKDVNFYLNGLTPGSYRAYAFSNIDGLEYANPEAMRDFAGQQIELGPSQKANVSLDLIVRGSN